MRTEYLKSMRVKDGYFGDTKVAHLCFDLRNGITWAVYSTGWHRTNLPVCIDAEEAIFLLNHPHPEVKRI